MIINDLAYCVIIALLLVGNAGTIWNHFRTFSVCVVSAVINTPVTAMVPLFDLAFLGDTQTSHIVTILIVREPLLKGKAQYS